ncbi:MAG TPA: 6-phosphogluconolactonase [Candidatus Limnocylindria bacterium]|nr:6-phosphogluconolactonase [Candidatus Limnocylindria bacterium]
MRSPTVFPDAERLAAAAATIVAETLRSTPTLRLVLAGGNTPKRCYALLAGMGLEWSRVTVLFGDERCLPPLDPETNYRSANETLLRIACPATVHRIPGELGPDEAAAAYEPVVAAGPLDLVLLGIGTDGHTASLFPNDPALRAAGYVAGVRDAPKPPPERVTMTLRALRGAKRVVILAAGADKRDAVRKAFAGAAPAGMIEHAEWLVTADAR